MTFSIQQKPVKAKKKKKGKKQCRLNPGLTEQPDKKSDFPRQGLFNYLLGGGMKWRSSVLGHVNRSPAKTLAFETKPNPVEVVDVC